MTALSWSTPGLSKNGRSVLAVLTSNLVLSLWESTSNPAEPSSWRRVLIVNNAIEEHLSNEVRLGASLRKQRRIRSAEWANHSNYIGIERQASSATQLWPNTLKVVNDVSQIIFLQILSPYGMQALNYSKWQAVVSLVQLNSPLSLNEHTKPNLWIDEVGNPLYLENT